MIIDDVVYIYEGELFYVLDIKLSHISLIRRTHFTKSQ